MLMEIVNKNYDRLNATDVAILTYVTKHGDEVSQMGIEALAKACYTSKSTVLRLVQKLGFSGYSDFKSYIKWERESAPAQGDYQDRLDAVQWDIAQTCRGARSSTDIVAIAQAIASSRTVVLFGTGEAQRYCAREMQRSFMELGVYLFYTGALEELSILIRTLGPDDLVVFISLSGSLGQLRDVMRLVKVRGLKTASITNLKTNELAELCDYNAYAIATPLMLPSGVEHSSFASFYVVIESIYVHYLRLMDQREDNDSALLS